MKTYFILSIVLCLVLGCAKAEKKPKNILDKDIMVKLLVEIHISESKCGQSYLRGDTSKVLYGRLETDIFKNMKVSKKSYDTSYSYYAKHLTEFEDIYARVVDSLSLREQLHKL